MELPKVTFSLNFSPRIESGIWSEVPTADIGSCCGASSAEDMDVGDFLSRCSDLKPVLTGEKDADLDEQKKLSWCTSHLSIST